MIMHQLNDRAGKMLEDLQEMLIRKRADVANIETHIHGAWQPFQSGDRWGEDEWQNFRFALDVPTCETGYAFFLYATTGREGLWDAINPQFVVKVNGHIVQAFDVNHTRMPLSAGHVEIELDGYVNRPEDGISYPYLMLSLCEVNAELEQLIFDLKVPYEACQLLPADNAERERTLETLSRALDLLDLRDPHSTSFNAAIAEARSYLQKEYYAQRAKLLPVAIAECVGHTHIDVAWLWDLYQTRHKAVRSFSTVLSLMDRYPDYKFMSSQPVLYDFVKQDAPEVFERIRQRVEEGRWEPEGGMWVEADCNITGGESLARQFLFGQRFFQKEFGKTSRILWLPDVFGYSAALPQLMKLSGIDYFMTTKLSWSEFNLTPYDTFLWKGIDGTKVLTHFSPARDYDESGHGDGHEGLSHFTTYNAMLNPSQIAGGWKRFQQKALDDHILISYGYGDGGGGPTDWMLEQARRMQTPMPETPAVKFSHARPFFEALETRVSGDPRLPVWNGELYLELHRGTYTAQGHNKRNNRKIEYALRKTELRCAQAALTGKVYPRDALNAVWKDVLTLQFHDILPGSSIRKVYEDSDRMYADGFGKLAALRGDCESALFEPKANALSIYNDLSFRRNDVISFPALDASLRSMQVAGQPSVPLQRAGNMYFAFAKGLNPCGATNVTLSEEAVESAVNLHIDRNGFDTPFYTGRFDAGMRIVSLYDKRAGRELCREGKALNRIVCYENRPRNYDAWEVSIFYKRRSWEVDQVESVECVTEGPVCAILRVTRKYMHSTIVQDICLYADLPRIDFRTKVDWHEPKYLLKAHFPLDVFYKAVACDIQYGEVERPTCKNTSWDAARFEICAHKWVDVSEPDYGVALLNDCKYGHTAEDEDLALTLLKSSTYPDPQADIGEHIINYALYPHQGDRRAAAVAEQANMFNSDMEILPGMRALNDTPLAEIVGEGALVEAVKMAEDSDALVVRLYECRGCRRTVHLKSGFPFGSAVFCNILEEPGESVPSDAEGLRIELKPYQIVSVLLK